MTPSTGAGGTALPAETTGQYTKGKEYAPADKPDTQPAVGPTVPRPYAKTVSASPEQEGVSVIYDHERAQREMGFLRLNKVLEARRK